ncbi:DUF190 domain-containing protein [Pseudomonas coleopterorum]|uniref:DUF190 domain-containing protein n=1 Tax=Pseudomonas coleopterorum TaxID=1605838 RepID=A0AAJ6MUT4_9PSED|nr:MULTISPECIES: DUF190 domain-containing protein [Pseudomonas]WNC11174.1 DUF190 domain-containing protein [Pseudomonas coleopterorum]
MRDDGQTTRCPHQNGRRVHQPLTLDLAKELHLSGATLSVAAEGFGQDGKRHSAHFLSLPISPSR